MASDRTKQREPSLPNQAALWSASVEALLRFLEHPDPSAVSIAPRASPPMPAKGVHAKHKGQKKLAKILGK